MSLRTFAFAIPLLVVACNQDALTRDEAGLLQWVRIEHLLPDDVQALLFAGSHA